MTEHDIAVMEAHMVQSCFDYFNARPHRAEDDAERLEKLYVAAYQRGWKAALKEKEKHENLRHPGAVTPP